MKTITMGLLGVFLLLSGQSHGASYLKLYFFPPSRSIDWSTPQKLIQSQNLILAEAQQRKRSAGNPTETSVAGFTAAQISCGEVKWVRFTPGEITYNSQVLSGHTWPAQFESEDKIKEKMIRYVSQGRTPHFLSFELTETSCGRIRNFLAALGKVGKWEWSLLAPRSGLDFIEIAPAESKVVTNEMAVVIALLQRAGMATGIFEVLWTRHLQMSGLHILPVDAYAPRNQSKRFVVSEDLHLRGWDKWIVDSQKSVEISFYDPAKAWLFLERLEFCYGDGVCHREVDGWFSEMKAKLERVTMGSKGTLSGFVIHSL